MIIVSAMCDRTNEHSVSIGAELIVIQEAGKGERLKLFINFSIKVGVVKNLLLMPSRGAFLGIYIDFLSFRFNRSLIIDHVIVCVENSTVHF